MNEINCTCFNASVDPQAQLLILGSMPSVRSLAQQEYYAHPQNRFWPIMQLLFAESNPPATYEQRLQMLLNHRIALWDVLYSCDRQGSLDAAIANEQPNDFPSFFAQYPQIKKICFNGNKAAQSFKKHQKALYRQGKFIFMELPSTSPANAKWRLPDLTQVWREALCK